jgi:hypothetical protein
VTRAAVRDRRSVRFVIEIAGRFLSHGASFATNLLVLRFVGFEEFGLFAVALAVQAAASIGWNQNVLGVAASRLIAGGSERPWGRYLLTHVGVTMVFVAVLASLGYGVFALAAVVGLLEALLVYRRPRLMAEARQDWLALGVTASQWVRLAIVLVIGLSGALSVGLAVAAQAPGYAVGAYLQGRGLTSTPESARVGHWTMGWRPVISDVLNTLVRFGPTTLVFGSIGQAAAGAFDVAMRGAYLLGEGIAALGVVDLPGSLHSQSAGQRRTRQRRTLVSGFALSAICALAYGLFYPFVVVYLARASISLSLAWVGAVAMIGIAMFGLSRTLLWESREGHRALIATQLVMCVAFALTFGVANLVGTSIVLLAGGFAASWFFAAGMSVWAAVRLGRRQVLNRAGRGPLPASTQARG